DCLALDSLQAITLQAQIEETLGVSLPQLVFLQKTSVQLVATQALALMEQSPGIGPERKQISPSHEPRETHPLSYEQERIWMLSHRTDNSGAYNLCFSFRILGRLNVTVFQQSLNDVLSRQAALRSAFPIINGRPVQRVCELSPPPMPLVDLSGHPRKEQESL